MEQTETRATERNEVRLVVAALVAVCLAVFGQVIAFQFINYDDNLYVYENPAVTSGLTADSLKWAFTSFHSANWHPLTWISHMLDVTLFGPNAGGHHLTNAVLHTANSVLAFFVFRRLTGDLWKSAVVAFLFAVHPVHVESVAWVSERKDVLSTLFWLLTMLLYARYSGAVKETASISQRIASPPMLLAIVMFALGLMSKPMLVTLPFVLLLLDWWPLERLKKAADFGPLVLEKLPLFILAGVSSYITLLAQGAGGAIQNLQVVPLNARLLNAAVSYGKYIAMLVLPVDLGVGYAYEFPFPTWQLVGSIILLAGISLLCMLQLTERKYLMTGWLWFLGTMVPVIGIVQVGAQSMADRYTYVPYFGLFIMLVWGVGEFVPKLKLNRPSTGVAVAIPILVLGVLAFQQTSKWKDAETLYTHTLNSGQGNFSIMLNYCNVLLIQNRLAEAETQCRNAIAADPGFPHSYVSLGVINVRTGKLDDAVANFRKAIELRPDDPMAVGNLAAPLALQGQTDEAQATLERALDLYKQRGLDPASLSTMYMNLSTAFAKQRRFDKAAECLNRVLQYAPDRADARSNYALALFFQDKLDEAKSQAELSIRQNPNQAESYNVLGMVLSKQGDRTGAARQFEQALERKPDFAEAKENLQRVR